MGNYTDAEMKLLASQYIRINDSIFYNYYKI